MNHKNRCRFFSHTVMCMLMLFSAAVSYADEGSATDSLRRFVSNVEAFNRLYPQEKVYLHFDNTSYYVGETIWFKAYVVRADDLRLSTESQRLHVQLLTQEGTIVDSRLLKIENGQCHGEFVLNEDYSSGYYEVRAYTQQMLNYAMVQLPYEKEVSAFYFNMDYTQKAYQESEACFSRVFPVYCQPAKAGNYGQKTIRTRPQVTGKNEMRNPPPAAPNVRFYPEGGSLVNGLLSKVAFEVLGEEDEPLSVEGYVVKGNSTRGNSFKSNMHGRGSFYLVPEIGGEISITYKRKTFKYDLPDVLPEGCVMTVDAIHSDTLSVTVQHTALMTGAELGLSIVCRGKPYVFQNVRLGEGDNKILIPKSLLPSGVNQVTLFDAEGTIYAERMFFVNHNDYAVKPLKIIQTEKQPQPYSKDSFDLSLSEPVRTFLSVSVSDQASRELNYGEQSIVTDLLLSSDLKGFIENPQYYFVNDDSRHLEDLDLLMLVQGWTRYDWSQMAGVTPYHPLYGKEIPMFRMSGRVFPLQGFPWERNHRIQKGLQVEGILLIDTTFYYGRGDIDSLGYFTFNLPEVYGNGILYINVIEKKEMKATSAAAQFFPDKEALHWTREFIPINENYVPRAKILSYYEMNPVQEEDVEVIKNEVDARKALPGEGDAFSLLLPEVEVKARNHAHPVDYSQPAISLNPIDELNYQMDIGMYSGIISKELIGLNAAVRHGYRGWYTMLFNQYENAWPGAYLDDGLANELVPVSTEGQVEGFVFSNNSERKENASIYMRKFLTKSTADGNLVDVARQPIPYSSRFEKIPLLENVSRIYIYGDLNQRKMESTHELAKSWTQNFVVNFRSYPTKYEKVPIYNGRMMVLRGYSSSKEYYQPVYENIENGKMPADHRRTLYWNPNLSLDEENRATIGFYNNSSCSHYAIDVEGITESGELVVYKNY